MPKNEVSNNPSSQNKKKKIILLSLLAVAILIVIISVSVGINSNNTKKEYQPTEEQLRMQLEIKEQTQPLNYLSIERAELKKDDGLFTKANKGVITGYIVNSATMAKYKDVKISVTYYSQTKSVITTDNYVLYEYYLPNSKKSFSINVTYPQTCKSYNVKIINAKAAD